MPAIIKAYGDAPRSGVSLGNTPPVVTSLPANPQFGEQVLLYSTTPYAGYQLQQWVGSWVILNDSRATGPWQSFVPTLSQNGTMTLNVNYAKYVINGKTVTASFDLGITGGTATAGATVILGFGSGSTALPTAANSSGIHGSYRWFDAGVSNWVGTICGTSTTSVFFLNDGNGNQVGTSGTLSGPSDSFRGMFTYEAA